MGLTRKRVVLHKTASYTVTSSDCGALITNYGASGAVTITLPAVTSVGEGFWVDVYAAADQSLTVATATTDTLVVANDVAADSIAWSTSSEKAGNGGTFICYSGGWLFQQHAAVESTTAMTQTIVTN